MDYTMFCIRYVRSHAWMTDDELSNAIPVAWDRAKNANTGDELQYWMQDTIVVLSCMRAINKLHTSQ